MFNIIANDNMMKTKLKTFMFKNIEDSIKLKIQKFTLSSSDAKLSNIDIVCILVAKITTKTCLTNYSKVFDFNSNIKITYKNIDESACIMLPNEIVHNLMHNEYLLMSKKTVNESAYAQFVINKSNISLFYTKHTSTLKKSIMTFSNVVKLNSTSCRLKNKFKNFNNNDFHLDKTLNSISFSNINKNPAAKKSKKSKLLISEKCKITFSMIDKNPVLKKLKGLKLSQHLNKDKRIMTADSDNIKTKNE